MNILRTSYTTLVSLCLSTSFAMAQKNEIINNNIASLQVVAEDKWLAMPVIRLNGNEFINIAFDDLTHIYHRYAYNIEHCEADWSISTELFESDYCDGFATGNIIEDFEESLNTNTLYTHYKLSIPNENCKIKLSGNYRITVYDENTNDTAFTACFMVVEPLMHLNMAVSSNTDIDTNKCHQQLNMELDYQSVSITNPCQEIYTVVMQNGRWDTRRCNVKPQFITSRGLKWEHNKSLIFDGGNEYRKFEILSTDHPTLGIENLEWDGKDYNAMIWTDLPRPNYSYDEDANGAFYIRNSDNYENDKLSDYINVHFRLKTSRQSQKVYINGTWTNHMFTPKYEMNYNPLDEQYEATLKLKQGYYSYQYLMLNDNGVASPLPSEGNFFQTENEYQAFVYWRAFGQRTYKLVGFTSLKYK